MKTIKNILKLLIIFISIWIPYWVIAAWIDHFEIIISPEKAKTWEALDITSQAGDRDHNLVPDYHWSIMVFSESDPEADFPNELKENSYTFMESDQWEVKFENAVVFNNRWIQDIHVYDLIYDDVLWIAEVEISEDKKEENVVIEILSPETWIMIWEKKISVSWTTSKNHKVIIEINWTREVSTNTNSAWVYEKEIDNLEDWENSIVAKVLNSDEEVIWESEVVNINVDSSKPSVKSLSINIEWEVEAESEIELEIISNPWLNNVSVIINDTITTLEDSDWKWIYKWTASAPKEAWTYSIDAVLVNELWHEVKELAAWSVTVKASELNSSPEKVTNNSADESNNQIENTNSEERKDLTITWLKVVWLKTKSIMTWDEIKWIESYSIYQKLEDDTLELIDTTTEPKYELAITWDEVKHDYFLVKATAKTSSWILYEWDLSKAIKVQTWPEIYLLLLISLILWSSVFYFKRRNQNI